MDKATPPRSAAFSHYAAKFSWVCPIITVIVFALLILDRQILPRKTIALVASSALCLLVVGLILGAVALLGISKHGRKGILAPAIVGVIINGLLISFVVLNFITARVAAGSAPSFTTVDAPLRELVAQSPIIVYARADTNNLPNIRFVIAEVWKGSQDVSAAGCAVGTQILRPWPAKYGTLPDGAILFYRRSIPASGTYEIAANYMVRGGHIGGTTTMTIQQFKAAFGL